jgi:(p)ppGpp synthase/HD superfamily hydrolase
LVAFSIPVKRAKAKSLGDNFIECSFSIESNSLKQLQELIQRVRKINGVRNVFLDMN